jgi:type I restriction enzyme S subunit
MLAPIRDVCIRHNKSNRIGKTITISGSGASAGYVSFHDYPIFASDCSTISSSNNYNVEFIFYWLQLNQNFIYSLQTGGAQPHIHPSDLNPLEISMPSIDVQNQSAKTFTDLQMELNSLEAKLQKLKLQKQGMMQALLTGKIRLL